ncbi:hypothetical protein AcW2_006424 [Taiwanofungus camphoratus]|nr:hypothetical protein AcW2_006424 [Antrodia cinnamomea]
MQAISFRRVLPSSLIYGNFFMIIVNIVIPSYSGPERFISSGGVASEKDPHEVAFGFGRRGTSGPSHPGPFKCSIRPRSSKAGFFPPSGNNVIDRLATREVLSCFILQKSYTNSKHDYKTGIVFIPLYLTI